MVEVDAEKKNPGEPARNCVVAAKGGGKTRVDVPATPFKRFGPRFQRFRARYALGPEAERPVRPDMHLAHVTNRSAPHVLDGGASIVRGMTMAAPLRSDFRFFCATRKLASFFD